MMAFISHRFLLSSGYVENTYLGDNIMYHFTHNIVKLSTSHIHRWFNNHVNYLSRLNVITVVRARKELSESAKNLIDKGKYDSAISMVCKLHDLYDSYLFDGNDYEPISLNDFKHRAINYQRKINNINNN